MKIVNPRSALLLAVAGCSAMACLLAACGGDAPVPDRVAFFGRLLDGAGNGIAGADAIVTAREGAILSQATTDADGRFVAGGLEKNVDVAMVFSGSEDLVRTVFTGETESNDMFLFSGFVYQLDLEGRNDVVADYTAAVGSTSALMTFDYATPGSGAMVAGRVVRLMEDEAGFFWVNAPGATVTVTDGGGNEYPVYYRGDYPNDEDPGPIEPGRTETGDDARFAAFAVAATGIDTLGFPAGAVTVAVTTSDGTFSETTLVVEDGLTAFDLFTVP